MTKADLSERLLQRANTEESNGEWALGKLLRDAATALVEREAYRCKARNASGPPQDCDWPHCGCDPAAEKVIAALQEEGWLSPAEREALTAERDTFRDDLQATALALVEYDDDHYIPERDGRRCVNHPNDQHELVCLTCLEQGDAEQSEARVAALQAEADIMKADLYRIGEALGVPALPYSGHEAVGRDFLPRVLALQRDLPGTRRHVWW